MNHSDSSKEANRICMGSKLNCFFSVSDLITINNFENLKRVRQRQTYIKINMKNKDRLYIIFNKM